MPWPPFLMRGIGGGGRVSILFPAKLLRATEKEEPRFLIELLTHGLISDALSTSEKSLLLIGYDELRDAAALFCDVVAT